MKTDVLIAGSGCAGLYCALSLPKDRQITIVTKKDVVEVMKNCEKELQMEIKYTVYDMA